MSEMSPEIHTGSHYPREEKRSVVCHTTTSVEPETKTKTSDSQVQFQLKGDFKKKERKSN